MEKMAEKKSIELPDLNKQLKFQVENKKRISLTAENAIESKSETLFTYDGDKMLLKAERIEHVNSNESDPVYIEFYFDIFNKRERLIEIFVFIDYRTDDLPKVEMGVNKTSSAIGKDRYKGMGRIFMAKIYEYILDYMLNQKKEDFRHVITRDPELSEVNMKMRKNQWMSVFGAFLKAQNYKKMEKDEDGNERWSKIYKSNN
jgi:hypothetical protein